MPLKLVEELNKKTASLQFKLGDKIPQVLDDYWSLDILTGERGVYVDLHIGEPHRLYIQLEAIDPPGLMFRTAQFRWDSRIGKMWVQFPFVMPNLVLSVKFSETRFPKTKR